MRLVLVGPPGSGKGTQAKLLVQRQQLRYIGTGDILRDAIKSGTPVGKIAEPLVKEGRLVPDQLVNQVVEELFKGKEVPRCFVLDGYPRTVTQAKWFDDFMHTVNLDLDAVIQFTVTDDEVVRRISGRRVCPTCGAVYHMMDRKPKALGLCDHDGASLILRDDDKEETIRRRLEVFHDAADDLIAHYRNSGLLREVPTDTSVEEIYNHVLGILNQPKKRS
jgi:adenylate kinase